MNLYLKTEDKALLSAVLEPYLEGEPIGTYFQNDKFCVDWIGRVPVKDQDPDAEEIEYVPGLHFNVKLLDESAASVFSSFETIYPLTPFRVWWE